MRFVNVSQRVAYNSAVVGFIPRPDPCRYLSHPFHRFYSTRRGWSSSSFFISTAVVCESSRVSEQLTAGNRHHRAGDWTNAVQTDRPKLLLPSAPVRPAPKMTKLRTTLEYVRSLHAEASCLFFAFSFSSKPFVICLVAWTKAKTSLWSSELLNDATTDAFYSAMKCNISCLVSCKLSP